MRACISLLTAFSLAVPSNAQVGVGTGNLILLVVPESDTVSTASAVYRLSASTTPGSKVDVNGKQFMVFPTGAFAGLLNLNVGDNLFNITSTNPAGEKVTKSFLIKRSKPIESTPRDTLLIEDIMMLPWQDMWLAAGDVLQVQFKGTPGCKASFMNDIPMSERQLNSGRGIAGIYRGTYRVKETDTLLSQRITFRLEDSTGRAVTRSTAARVSFKPHQLPVVGITKGDRPFLNTSLGEDRLGAHKFSIINPGIRLKITGKVNAMYRVALTDNLQVWIDSSFVDLQPGDPFMPKSLTGNITVSAEPEYDVVSVTLGDRLPYSTTQELDPTRIIVDVYGATSNTNWITQTMTTREIRNVYYQQIETDVFRIIIEVEHKQIWGYEIGYEGTTLKVRIKPQPRRLKIKYLTIAVDAGHGGENLGALGATGLKEKDVALIIANHVKTILEDKGGRVILTRTNDSNPTITERFLRAYKAKADLLVSIHANSVGLTSDPLATNGAATFYKHICYRPLSQFVLNEIVKAGLSSFGNVGSFNFALLGPTELPSVLIETAFISHPEDEMKLLDEDFRKELAERIVDGIENFLDSCEE